MKTIIFKNAKKAKSYNVFSACDQGVYKSGELIGRFFTDKIEEVIGGMKYQATFSEAK